jgi:2-keto-3-deoxy-L-fuconate dehydrogenase
MGNRLEGKQVFVTQSADYMGPAISSLFSTEGAVVSSEKDPVPMGPRFSDYVSGQQNIDILVANLAHDPCNSPVADIADDNWQSLFDTMVHPLMYLIRHFAPIMAERGAGKIVAITSAAPLKGLPGSTAYCAARGAQNAFIRATGLEFGPANVQINAVAQNYVSNPAYFPDDLVATERFQKHLQRNVPVGRVARSEESAELALFLASDKSDFIVGQVIPFAGGWVTTT